MLICWHTVYSCFFTITAKLVSCDRCSVALLCLFAWLLGVLSQWYRTWQCIETIRIILQHHFILYQCLFLTRLSKADWMWYLKAQWSVGYFLLLKEMAKHCLLCDSTALCTIHVHQVTYTVYLHIYRMSGCLYQQAYIYCECTYTVHVHQ